MSSEDIVHDMMRAALNAARARQRESDTPEARAAYARGVRAMASLVHACANVAMDYAEQYREHPAAGVMFQGYETALRRIVKAADALIPDGYET